VLDFLPLFSFPPGVIFWAEPDFCADPGYFCAVGGYAEDLLWGEEVYADFWTDPGWDPGCWYGPPLPLPGVGMA
jgi:hypothetical protein